MGRHLLSDAPLHGSYEGKFHLLGRPFTAFPSNNNSFVRVASLSTDAHPPARANLKPISAEYLQPHNHQNTPFLESLKLDCFVRGPATTVHMPDICTCNPKPLVPIFQPKVTHSLL
ncbi:hypothetical protein O181_038992 [Austropuccinia psidii MF-1]|uniref:Uncharacterized protein n=1 Tax=Austropuccinia psidii MF-1 TaxID=1389203 RepID=A0A9Q3DFV0_9BASI|nr:hypothetical protein [Austropuccinia psidii MF-1]